MSQEEKGFDKIDLEATLRGMNALQTKEGKLEVLSRDDYDEVSDIIDFCINGSHRDISDIVDFWINGRPLGGNVE